jgi:hypothetical protein
MDDRFLMLHLGVSSAILDQLANLNAMVALTNESLLPAELKAAVLASNRRAGELAEKVRDALVEDAAPEWERDRGDDE